MEHLSCGKKCSYVLFHSLPNPIARFFFNSGGAINCRMASKTILNWKSYFCSRLILSHQVVTDGDHLVILVLSTLISNLEITICDFKCVTYRKSKVFFKDANCDLRHYLILHFVTRLRWSQSATR